jgi:serine/threonine protein kinase
MLKTETIDITCMGCFEQLESSDGVCPVCGYNEAAQDIPPHQLRPRTILYGKYLLGKVLGEGGFGITYIGWDLNLDLKVAIKEYYPAGFVTREITTTNKVQAYTGSRGDFFTKGRERFVDEAKRMARFRTMPGIVTVNDFFIENGTAYIAMEFVEGQTLKSHLSQMGGKLPATQVVDMLRPVMISLAQVHKSGMIHRDISPDNIMISKEGYVKLLDFGAAREFADSGNRSLSIMLKPGYAPEEQYRSRGVQGPWTDIYALCATMYKAITGVTPDDSSERMRRDEVKRPSELGVMMPSALEAVLMKGMAMLQEDRWQSVDELMEALNEAQGYGVGSPKPKTESDSELMPKTEPDPEPKTESDPEFIPPRRSEDSNPQPIQDKKKNSIVSRLVKNKIAAAIGSIAVVFIGIAFYQMVAGANDRAYRDADSYKTESRDAEDDYSSKEAIDNGNNTGNNASNNTTVNNSTTENSNSTDNNNSSDSNSQSSLLPPNLTIGQNDVVFGDYTWRVLDIQDEKALLLSEEVITQNPYHNDWVDITWEDCDLRKYLNGTFLQSFTQEEQDAIVEVTNINDDNQWYGTEGGNTTQDKIFLLSIEEVVTYFCDSGELENWNGDDWPITDQYSGARQAKNGNNWSWWWLRSPGYYNGRAARIGPSGGLYVFGLNNTDWSGVRPALWIRQ